MDYKFGLLALLLSTVFVIVLVSTIEDNYQSSDTTKLYYYSTPLKLNSYNLSVSNKLMDLRDFNYVARADCKSNDIIWVITSYAGEPEVRSAIRRAYKTDELEKLGVRRVFLLGLLSREAEVKTQITQNAIVNESDKFGDIVQGNFIEAYKNLTYKHLMGLKWASESCSTARFIMKMDHDIVIDLYDILDEINGKNYKSDGFVGYAMRNMTPLREKINKWFVTYEEFGLSVYPDFVSGWFYLTSPSVARKIVKSSEDEQYFWIDDAFVTGILREKLGIPIQDIRDVYTTDYRFLECCMKDKKRRLKCNYSVGPNGGVTELVLRFREFANFCNKHCIPRVKGNTVDKTCIIKYRENFSSVSGRPQIIPYVI